MIERRVLKEKEKRRVKKKKEGGGEEGVCGGAGERIQLSLKKKSHFLQSQIIVFIKVEKKKCLFCTVSPAWRWYYPYCC